MHLLTPVEGEEYLTSVTSVGWSAELGSHCVSLEYKNQGYIIKRLMSRECSVVIQMGARRGLWLETVSTRSDIDAPTLSFCA